MRQVPKEQDTDIVSLIQLPRLSNLHTAGCMYNLYNVLALHICLKDIRLLIPVLNATYFITTLLGFKRFYTTQDRL